MPAPRTLVEIALQSTADNIDKSRSLENLDEHLALVLFELVLSKGKLTPRILSLFQELVEEGKRREEQARQREAQEAQEEGEEVDLFSSPTARANAVDNAVADDKTLYSALAARIATLRIRQPPPVVPLGTGRWLGDLPPPWT